MDKVQSDFDKLRLALASELGPDWYMAQASQQALIAYATAPVGQILKPRGPGGRPGSPPAQGVVR